MSGFIRGNIVFYVWLVRIADASHTENVRAGLTRNESLQDIATELKCSDKCAKVLAKNLTENAIFPQSPFRSHHSRMFENWFLNLNSVIICCFQTFFAGILRKLKRCFLHCKKNSTMDKKDATD
jgi:hypothetical protein